MNFLRQINLKKLSYLIIEILISSILLYFTSKIIYNKENISRIQQSIDYEPNKLEKMQNLWPPPNNPIIYLIFSTACHFLHSNVTSTPNNFFGILLTAISCFIWLMLPQRIAEMHIAVMILNAVHTTISLFLTYIIFKLFNNKVKNE